MSSQKYMIDFQSDFRFLALPSVISHIPNKRRAWNDIIRLTGDKSEYIRKKANRCTLIFIFPDVPDKEKVWADFLGLTTERDGYFRDIAVNSLEFVFPYLDNKDSVWKELIEHTQGEDEHILRKAADTRCKGFL